MAGQKYIIIVLLLHSQTAYTLDKTCTTKEMRKGVVDEALAALNCDDYNCVLKKLSSFGTIQSNPASSCAEIFNNSLSVPSGYYWLKTDNGSAVSVYCDMSLNCKGVGGGWMQVVKLNMTNSSQQCPPGTGLRTDLPKRLCGDTISSGIGCSSTIFDVQGIEYGKVCGKIIAYQDGTPDAFGGHGIVTRSNNIDGNYVDGITLTHGNNPRQHIWTFTGTIDDLGVHGNWRAYCPCTNINFPTSASQPPSFVGNDYFCDTASHHPQYIFYPDDPLWDGTGCGQTNTCCSLNNPPWFFKQLPSSTTDGIEMRMCRDQAANDESTPFEIIELYVC